VEFRSDVVDAVQSPLGTSSIRLFGDQALFKPAKHGSRVLWHQDNEYWQLEPSNVVTMWLALDDVDDRNGCMRVIPGTHQGPLLDHVPSTENEELRGIEVNEGEAVSVHVPTGRSAVHPLKFKVKQ
jgi:phytanoyl-CoA hydroxylase